MSVLVVLCLLTAVVWVEARYLSWRQGDQRRRQERADALRNNALSTEGSSMSETETPTPTEPEPQPEPMPGEEPLPMPADPDDEPAEDTDDDDGE